MTRVTSETRFTDRLVFLHGFTQTHHHWHDGAHAIVSRLPTAPSLTFVDLPGHGLSGADRTPIDAAGATLAELAGPGTYLGYSMGGRFALAAAVDRPDLVERIVLIGATAGIVDPRARIARRETDESRAEALERDGVEAFLDRWLAAAMFADLPADPDGLEHRRRNSAAGLASSLRLAGTGAQKSRWGDLERVTGPVLVLAGANDPTFCEIGRALADAVPDGDFRSVAAAGHAAHIAQMELTAELIAEWLQATDVDRRAT